MFYNGSHAVPRLVDSRLELPGHMDDSVLGLSDSLVHRSSGVLSGLGRFLRRTSPASLVINKLLDGVRNGLARIDHILGGECVPIVVFGVLHGGSCARDLLGEELMVRLVLERDEGAADVEGSSGPG